MSARRRSRYVCATQTISSAQTCNRNQVPALFRRVRWKRDTVNVDIGGCAGAASRFLTKRGVRNQVFDPYHQDDSTNSHALQIRSADTATLANVLNVINSARCRRQALRRARTALRPGGEVLISVYEGDQSGRSRATSRGHQENRPLTSYLAEVRKVFPGARIEGGIIRGRRPRGR
jgi:hypothetical protein